ncbi:MAG: antibiotic biosynthesis monooxygenase, partial [Eggerthellaceae bacterium]|nr:antibiotic biosynthesis monooxygenase [Eggerthellaceae bacterium]
MWGPWRCPPQITRKPGRYSTGIMLSWNCKCWITRSGGSMITVQLRYTGTGGAARAFAEEMLASGTVDLIRAEAGNLRYEYYLALEDPETVLLIDSWA